MFAYKPTAITERVTPYTYGLGAYLPFQDGVHPADNFAIMLEGSHGVETVLPKLKNVVDK